MPIAGRTFPRKSSDPRKNQSPPRSAGLKRLTANPSCTFCAPAELAEHDRPTTTSAATSARNQTKRQGWNAKPTILFAFGRKVKQLAAARQQAVFSLKFRARCKFAR